MGSLEEAVSARKRALDASASYLQFLWKADLVESWIREWAGLVNKWVELIRMYVACWPVGGTVGRRGSELILCRTQSVPEVV